MYLGEVREHGACSPTQVHVHCPPSCCFLLLSPFFLFLPTHHPSPMASDNAQLEPLVETPLLLEETIEEVHIAAKEQKVDESTGTIQEGNTEVSDTKNANVADTTTSENVPVDNRPSVAPNKVSLPIITSVLYL